MEQKTKAFDWSIFWHMTLFFPEYKDHKESIKTYVFNIEKKFIFNILMNSVAFNLSINLVSLKK